MLYAVRGAQGILGAIFILRKDIGVGGWSRKWQFSLTLCTLGERNRHKDRQKFLIKIHPTRLFGPTCLIGT